MSYLDSAMKRLESMVANGLARAAPFRAIVASVSGGMVAIRRLEATSAETELRAVLAGTVVAPGDEVLCLPVAGKPFVLGRVQRGPGASSIVPVAAKNSAKDASTVLHPSRATYQSWSVAGLAPGVWGYVVTASGAINRSVNGGGMLLELRVENTSGAGADTYQLTDTGKAPDMTVPITMETPLSGTLTVIGTTANVIVNYAGVGAAATTELRAVAVSGFFYRIG